MFHKDKPETTPEPTPPLAMYDIWLWDDGLGPADFESAPPEEEPRDPNIRAEEEQEYRRAVS